MNASGLAENLKRRWKFFHTWCVGGRWAFGAVTALVAIFVICIVLNTGQPSNAVRWWGFTVQALGLYLVLSGLRTMPALLEEPTISDRLSSWMRNLYRVVFPTSLVGVEISVPTGHMAISAGEPGVVVTRDKPPTLEERVVELEENVTSLNEEIATQRQKAVELERKVIAGIRSEERARSEAVQKVETMVKKSALGVIDTEIYGVCFLFLGTVGTSLPQEIATLFRYLGIF